MLTIIDLICIIFDKFMDKLRLTNLADLLIVKL
jgi:hypothetical protein